MSKGIYRTVEVHIWGDPWVLELDTVQKLLFMYLWTNARTTPCGALEISLRSIAFETGIPEAELPERIRALAPKVGWWPEWNVVWVRSFFKHQSANTNTANFAIAARKALLDFPDAVRRAAGDEYPELDTLPVEFRWRHPDEPHAGAPAEDTPAMSQAYPTDGVSIDHASPMDGVRMTIEREVVAATATAGVAAVAPAPPPPRALRPLPPPPKLVNPAHALQTHMEEAAAAVLDREDAGLTRGQRGVVGECYTLYGARLTTEQVDYARTETIRNCPELKGALAYFLEILRRLAEEPDDTGGKQNGKGAIRRNGNGASASGGGSKQGRQGAAVLNNLSRIAERHAGEPDYGDGG